MSPAPADFPQLYADVVFDRPLDHAYSYSVPESLRDSIGVGKRVDCSFGRGEGSAVGYVIRVTEIVPTREVKPILKVLDEYALLELNPRFWASVLYVRRAGVNMADLLLQHTLGRPLGPTQTRPGRVRLDPYERAGTMTVRLSEALYQRRTPAFGI